MNRVQAAIERVEKVLAEKPEETRKLDASLATISLQEMAVYQKWKSEAQASGILTLDEAMTVYGVLNSWDKSSVYARLTVTRLMGELKGVK